MMLLMSLGTFAQVKEIDMSVMRARRAVDTLVINDLYLEDRGDSLTNIVDPADSTAVITVLDVDSIATGAMLYTDTYWDDLKAPFTSTRRGAADKPDFDYTNAGLLFPTNDTTEFVTAIMQFSHARKAGTDIEPHIHWDQINSNDVVWSMVYKWYQPGAAVPATWLKLIEQSDAFTYTSGTLHQITTFGTIDGSGISGVSSILKVKVYRDDAVAGGAGTGDDALATEFDVHYQIDSPGSDQEYIK